MKTALKPILIITLIPIIWVVGNLIYGTITDFEPSAEQPIFIDAVSAVGPVSTISLISWNIGYAGLGEESDFFYDGGETVRMDEETVRKNMDGVLNTCKYFKDADIFLLQEVDTSSRRSHYLNEYAEIGNILSEHNSSFTLNYKVNFVPVPFANPMGKVAGGLASYSRFMVTKATRHQFPSSYAWPSSIYFLDRCFLVQRMPYNNVELVAINTHNSAYDDGSLKAVEMDSMKDFLQAEGDKGNYVIVGGDWNQHTPGTGDRQVPEEYITGWNWVYDTSFPTNRNLENAYVEGETKTQVIDFFLCSPNISVEEIKVVNLNFKFSDHQPVYLRVKLN